MARKILRDFQGVQRPTDVVGFDKDRLHWDWSMRDKEDEEEEETEETEETKTETSNNQSSSNTQEDTENKQEETLKTNTLQKTNKPKRSAFGQAFDKARAAGKKTFWWKGKEYTTKTKAEADAEKKSASNKKSNTSNTSRSTSNNKNTTTNNKKSNTSSGTTKSNKLNTTKTSNRTSYSDYVKQTSKNVSDAEKKQAAGNNKQKHINVNNIKSVSSQVAERRRLNNRNNQLSAANDFNAYQHYRNNYNANAAKGYLNRAMQKPKTSPAFTADEMKAINRAEANRRKRNR